MVSEGVLISDEGCKNNTGKWTEEDGVTMEAKFLYTRQFDWHFQNCHIVDDHNNLCHLSLALEGTWIMMYWMVYEFSFFFTVTEVNLYNATWFLCGKGKLRYFNMLEFPLPFALELMIDS